MTFLYHAIYQVVLLLLKLLHPLNPKVQKGYQLRQPTDGKAPWLNFPSKTRPVWIHCASGEFEYALPLIRTIKQHKPEQKILITYFTPSYAKRIEQEPLVDFVCPAPWDTPLHIKDFLEHHQPRALLFARTDIWFEMTRQCHKMNIPIFVFSMTFNKQLKGLKKLFEQWRTQFIDHFFVVSSDDKKNLECLINTNKISVSGDTRYEQCLHRLSLHVPLKINTPLISKKIFIAGSTWSEDEDVLLPFIAQNKNLCHWILVPHEVSEKHLTNLIERCQKQGLKTTLYSQTELWDTQGVLIVDTVGVLAHLYKIADFSFIGGSFKKQVHSVMESLACGCLTFVGPFYQNNREAIEFSQSLVGFPISPVQICQKQTLANDFLQKHTRWTSTQSDRLKALVSSKAKVSTALYQDIQHRL